MDIIHHPAFQSLVLPTVLSWLCVWLLLRFAGPRWAPLGGVLALLLVLAVLPGFDWPATARAQKLPWIVLAGAVLAALWLWRPADGARLARWSLWCAAALLWAGAHAWLGAALWHAVAATLAGAAVLAVLLLPVGGARGVVPSAVLVIAHLALAALAGTGGSLLLAQLALMAASAGAVPGLWAWWRPSSGLNISRAALLPLTLATLVIAASLPVVAGLDASTGATTPDDIYYTPQWK